MSSNLSVPPTAGRSMLEEMLEAIKLRDEKQKGLVPAALPLRSALRGKLPSILPVKDESGEDADKVTKAMARPDMRELDMDDGLNGRPQKMNFSNAKEMEKHGYSARDGAKKVSSKNDHQLHASRLEVLEKLVESMKAELGGKEEKTVALVQQVQDYEKKWLLSEEKLKSMEEMYQRQIETLKVNIASVQKSLATNESVKQSGKCDNFSYPHGYDAKTDVPADTPIAEGMPTRHLVPETGIPKDMADTSNVIYVVKNDSYHQKQVLEVDACALGEMKPGQSGSLSKSMEDLANLKGRYAAWKREYEVHLRDTKAALEKLEKSEGGKPSRRWCCMKIRTR